MSQFLINPEFLNFNSMDFGSYDLGNFLDMGQVPQQQNNFSDAGNFFAKANAQMEQAANQETQTDKRIRLAGARGTAGKGRV